MSNEPKQVFEFWSDGKTTQLVFWCEACQTHHSINDRWTFNGDLVKPTVSPSILVRGSVPITDDEHARIMAGEKIEPKPSVCHSFVRDGMIEYLNDCTHSLAGKTVPLTTCEQPEGTT